MALFAAMTLVVRNPEQAGAVCASSTQSLALICIISAGTYTRFTAILLTVVVIALAWAVQQFVFRHLVGPGHDHLLFMATGG
jgi:branched-chain amino acid transport system permease protein